MPLPSKQGAFSSLGKLGKLTALICLLHLGGCAAITVTQSGSGDFTYYPHYQKTKHFFLWGLIGEHTVNTRAVCKETPVVQLQSKFTARDVLFGALTLGLYLPRTAMVWCEREVAES